MSDQKSFTLIELLIVIGILAVLVAAIVVTLNPAQLLAQARDASRLSELAAFNSAMTLYIQDAAGSVSLGSAGTTYISIPDPTATTSAGSNCSSLGFPSTGYHCAGPNFYRRTDGTGWLPVNFSAMSVGSPFATLPVDSVNTTSTGNYYRYTTDGSGSWTLSAVPESTKYLPQATSFQIGWACGSPLVDSRDGQSYATVQIGTQCWMAQNLNVGTKITSCTNGYAGVCTTGGDTLQNQGTSTTAIQKYCYNNDPAQCPTSTGIFSTTAYGGLYQWWQAMGGSTSTTGFGVTGICPTGWHLPTDNEYKTLEIYLGMCSGTGSNPNYCADDSGVWRGTTQGDQLKAAGLCSGRTPCGTSGFNGLLAGYRNADGSFLNQSSNAFFWSSLVSGGSAWYRYVLSGNATVHRSAPNQAYGFSVRCVKN
jgi:uncharacterized protein (TIGR02145 family)/prepilin-type N-terminal cleavage/methylation domain-containing protein